jgi:hypothetical protein
MVVNTEAVSLIVYIDRVCVKRVLPKMAARLSRVSDVSLYR